MARHIEQWIETTSASDDAALITLHLEKVATPFPLEWYKSNPRLTMDRLAKFEGNPEFTPYYDEGDI
jgi:hypothetical protein